MAANPHSSGAYQPNGVTCGFTITGSATGGGVDYGSGGVINPVVLTTDAVGIDFSTIVADLITEGSETVTITLDDFDSLGNPTFGLTKTITITDDSQAPVFDCNDSGMVINPGNVGDAVNFNINSGTVQTVNPTTYPLGTTYFTVTINAPATDPNGIPYSNAGQTVACSIPGIGTSPPESMYHIHWGNGAWPHAQDLEGNGPFFYEATGGNTSETSIEPILQDMIDNPSAWGVWTGVSQNSLTSGDTFSFPAGTGSNFYYFLIPDSFGTPDLTTVNRLSQNGGPAGAATSKLALTLGGYPCTMYKLSAAASINTLTLTYV